MEEHRVIEQAIGAPGAYTGAVATAAHYRERARQLAERYSN
jgi:hypothetical protein